MRFSRGVLRSHQSPFIAQPISSPYRESNLRSPLPTRRILAAVHGLNDDAIAGNSVIDRVWKSRQYGSPSVLMRSLIRRWILDDAIDDLVDGLSEFLAEPRTPRLVPLAHFKHFVFGLRPEDNLPRHAQPNNLRRTSDHGIAESGFATCSPQRRSSSARCSPVSSSAPSRSESERLSQRATASSARSLAGSLRSWESGLDAMFASSHVSTLRRNVPEADRLLVVVMKYVCLCRGSAVCSPRLAGCRLRVSRR